MDEKALPAYFGEWLKHRRKKLDLTQAELAGRAGCSVFALRKIESGERRPSKQLAGLLASSLEIPPEDRVTFIKVARGELNLERLRSPTPSHAADHSISQKLSPSRIVLPFQPTPLIGRETELSALGILLADPKCRLITITGMGGIGKTRLAVETATTQQALFPGGVYFVSLASLNSPEFIVPAIVEVLGFPFTGTLDPRDQLLNHLAARTKHAILLVLDNLEHLLVPPAPNNGEVRVSMLLAEMVQRTPNIKILATSRERVSIQGEWIFELHGLPVPINYQYDNLEDYSAAALFVQRARQVKANFEVLPNEGSSLASVCRLVEGTPLAIELAAAWVGVLSIDEIAREIETNLDFLATSMRNIPERHRSLRAIFDHSWKLLPEEEQLTLTRLAVFRGGFQRQAAERIAGASLSILMSLHSKSLLVRREDGRYDLHEVVRQYALSRLTSGPQNERTHDQHYKFFLSLVQEQEKDLVGAVQFNATQIIREELDNLRAAMAWAIAQDQVEYALQIAIALGQFWFTQGYWREGLEWLERGLVGSRFIANTVRATALTLAGRLSRLLGDYPRAISMLKESLELWQQIGDNTGTAMALINLGASVLYQGDTEGATVMLERALSLVTQQGNRLGMYSSLEALGHAASRQGNSSKAVELYNAALTLARETSDDNQVAKLLNAIGDEYMILGNYDRAEEFLAEAALISQRLGNRIIAAFVSANRGYIALKQGNHDRALFLLTETIQVFHELGDKEDAILCLEPIASIALEQHFPERAARLLGASNMQLSALGVIRSQPIQVDYDACHAEVRGQLNDAAFEEAWAGGSMMTYEQAIAYAVDPSW